MPGKAFLEREFPVLSIYARNLCSATETNISCFFVNFLNASRLTLPCIEASINDRYFTGAFNHVTSTFFQERQAVNYIPMSETDLLCVIRAVEVDISMHRL
jgi:hypothetical protein